MSSIEIVHPLLFKYRQWPPDTVARLAGKLAHILEISLELGVDNRKSWPVASLRDAIRLPLLLLGNTGQSGSASQHTCSGNCLPLKDFEGETSADLLVSS